MADKKKVSLLLNRIKKENKWGLTFHKIPGKYVAINGRIHTKKMTNGVARYDSMSDTLVKVMEALLHKRHNPCDDLHLLINILVIPMEGRSSREINYMHVHSTSGSFRITGKETESSHLSFSLTIPNKNLFDSLFLFLKSLEAPELSLNKNLTERWKMNNDVAYSSFLQTKENEGKEIRSVLHGSLNTDCVGLITGYYTPPPFIHEIATIELRIIDSHQSRRYHHSLVHTRNREVRYVYFPLTQRGSNTEYVIEGYNHIGGLDPEGIKLNSIFELVKQTGSFRLEEIEYALFT